MAGHKCLIVCQSVDLSGGLSSELSYIWRHVTSSWLTCDQSTTHAHRTSSSSSSVANHFSVPSTRSHKHCSSTAPECRLTVDAGRYSTWLKRCKTHTCIRNIMSPKLELKISYKKNRITISFQSLLANNAIGKTQCKQTGRRKVMWQSFTSQIIHIYQIMTL